VKRRNKTRNLEEEEEAAAEGEMMEEEEGEAGGGVAVDMDFDAVRGVNDDTDQTEETARVLMLETHFMDGIPDGESGEDGEEIGRSRLRVKDVT
jgi:hypothetical protein